MQSAMDAQSDIDVIQRTARTDTERLEVERVRESLRNKGLWNDFRRAEQVRAISRGDIRADTASTDFRPDHLRADSLRAGDTRPEAVRPENTRPEAVRPEGARPEAVRPEGARPEDVRVKDIRVKDIRPEDIRPEDIRPEDIRPEDIRPEDIRPEDIRPEDIRPEDIRPEDIRPEDIRPEDIRPEDIRPEDITTEDIRPEDITTEDITAKDIRTEDIRRKDTSTEEHTSVREREHKRSRDDDGEYLEIKKQPNEPDPEIVEWESLNRNVVDLATGEHRIEPIDNKQLETLHVTARSNARVNSELEAGALDVQVEGGDIRANADERTKDVREFDPSGEAEGREIKITKKDGEQGFPKEISWISKDRNILHLQTGIHQIKPLTNDPDKTLKVIKRTDAPLDKQLEAGTLSIQTKDGNLIARISPKTINTREEAQNIPGAEGVATPENAEAQQPVIRPRNEDLDDMMSGQRSAGKQQRRKGGRASRKPEEEDDNQERVITLVLNPE